jgi:aminoglycoside 3-N-acetyltransferase
MIFARRDLTLSLQQLGLKPGTIVMMHASVRSVGPVYGGPDEIHLALEDAVRPGGTVMMLAGCADGYDDVGRGIYTSEQERKILEHQPAFDPHVMRATREIGTLAEFFRSYPGTICSENAPGRMSARGARAAWITSDQPWNYGLGRGSPLDKLCDAGGKVLLLGSDHDEVTLLHYAEHVAEFGGKRIARYQVPVLRDGKRVWTPCEEFDTADRGVHPNWPDRFFATIVDDFIERYNGTEHCATGKVGYSDTVLLDAAALVSHAIPIMIARASATAI